MAGLEDIFDHGTPQIFPNEAPTTSANFTMGGFIDDALKTANDILRNKYGQNAGVPIGSTDSRTVANNTGNSGGFDTTIYRSAAANSATALVLLVVGAALIFLFLRR